MNRLVCRESSRLASSRPFSAVVSAFFALVAASVSGVGVVRVFDLFEDVGALVTLLGRPGEKDYALQQLALLGPDAADAAPVIVNIAAIIANTALIRSKKNAVRYR